MIELGALPLRGRVAQLRKSCGNPARDVVRVLGALEILEVAAEHTASSSRCTSHLRGTGASHAGVRAGQRELVFEWSNLAPMPLHGRVAQLRSPAGSRPCTWFGFFAPWKSFRWQPTHCIVVPANWPFDVALGAGHAGVRAGQRERVLE